MDPLNQNKINPKMILIVGGIIILLLLIVSLLTLSSNSKKVAQDNQAKKTAEEQRIRVALSLTPTPTYIPPANAEFATADSVNFLPHTINGFTLNQDKILKTAKQVYPNLDGLTLNKQINKDIFTWLALNEFYQSVDLTKVSAAYSTNIIENMVAISKDINAVRNDYNQNVMKIDGFYLKLRYKGTLPNNLKKLKKTEAELKPLATQLMSSYHDQAVKNPETVLQSFNSNNTVFLMNNRESSKSFTNYAIYPPLVGDVNYDSMIKTLPVGQVSNVITLTAKLNGKTVAEDYAYAIFYISNKTGSYLPLDALVNNYVQKATIK